MVKVLDGIPLKIGGGIIGKVLFVEIYFLLRSGKSPIFFSLADFVGNYSLELLYLAVFFVLLAPWWSIVVFGGQIVFGTANWLARRVARRFINHLDFSRDQEVSIELAERYAKFNRDDGLENRIRKHVEETEKRLLAESNAQTVLFLLLAVFAISFFTGAPNFVTKISSFFEPIFDGWAYGLCATLIFVPNVIGRIWGASILRSSGHLPANFFRGAAEREEVKAWVYEEIGKAAAER